MTFACIENSCRSQIAEALANRLFADRGLEFSSAGTGPADEVDPGAVEMLKGIGIDWKGTTKTFDDIPAPDVVVTMGCDVQCPYIPGARMFQWEIPDPRGKDLSEYLKVKDLIAEKLERLINGEI
ncbi:MAG: low molecular weight phosphatase family protein [Candidatus Krumholzibacteriota bacterium]